MDETELVVHWRISFNGRGIFYASYTEIWQCQLLRNVITLNWFQWF